MPLLVEKTSCIKKASNVLVVDVTPETQLIRTMQRDDVDASMLNTFSLRRRRREEARLAVADVYDNNGAPDIASDVKGPPARQLS